MKCTGVFQLIRFSAGSLQPLWRTFQIQFRFRKKYISSNQCNPFWLRSPSISAWSPKKRQTLITTTKQLPDLPSLRKCYQPKAKKKKIYIHSTNDAPTASLRPPFLPSCPHHTACGWIAASWRWTWSIRSINRDYCNPRGQEGGTGPRRVHTTHTCRLRANLAKNGKHLATRSCELTVTEGTHQTLFSTLVDTHWNDTRRFRASAHLMEVFTLTSWVEP